MSKRISHFIILFLPAVVTSFAQLDLSGLDMSRTAVKEPVTIQINRNKPEDDKHLSLALTFKMDKNIHIYSAESLFFKITLDSSVGLGTIATTLPKPKPFTNFDKTIAEVYIDGQQIVLNGPITSTPWKLKGSVQFQACDSAMCFTPRTMQFTATSEGVLTAGVEQPGNATLQLTETTSQTSLSDLFDKFTMVASRGGFLNVATFSAFLKNPETASENSSGGFEDKGLFIVILLILLGGIALNLTPCVLPMIPITIAVIGAGSQAKSRGRGMFVGSVYGFSMALTYGILGLIVVITGTRFGVINASPLFNIMIAVVFILMALAMFDIIQIDFTRFRKGGASESERGKLLTVFIMGIVASLLAGACVAPVVISVVLYAGTLYANGNPIGLILPFLLGVGMALPWPFAGAGLSFLPKPGKWMVWVKYVFGIFILVMALYYGYTGISLYRAGSASKTAESSEKPSNLPWIHSLEEGLQKGIDENKPVFIDFWATWCKNCKAMDATTFRAPEVETLFKNYIIIKYQAEQPDEPETKALLDRFGVVGLPTYVILQPK